MEMEPIVNGLEAEFGDRTMILRMDAADPSSARLQSQWGLRGHPSFAVVDASGQVTQKFFGPQPEVTLRQAIQEVLGQ